MSDGLADYWQRKYREARDEPTSQLVRSLRSQLTTIRRLARNSGGEDAADVLKSIVKHADIALALPVPDPPPALHLSDAGTD